MDTQAIDLYYFTGTGNTLLVARAMAEVFAAEGCRVRLLRIEVSAPERVDLRHTLGLAFPVACQSTYPLVWRFVRRLPQAQGTPIFMVDTLLAFSGGIVGPLGRLLRHKGYRTIGAREITMPNNLYPLRRNEEREQVKIVCGLEQARRYAHELLAGKTRWGGVPLVSEPFRLVMGGPLVWYGNRLVGRALRVDRERCTRCGLCAVLCPVDNIILDPYPQHGQRCEQCMRCVSFCPTEAISLPWFRHERYRAVTAREILTTGRETV